MRIMEKDSSAAGSFRNPAGTDATCSGIGPSFPNSCISIRLRAHTELPLSVTPWVCDIVVCASLALETIEIPIMLRVVALLTQP